MSYEILYSRQFVKLDEERVLPIILSGSSNCTMFWGNKEIRERNWFCWCNKEEIGEKTSVIRNRIEKVVIENKNNNYDGEWFKSNGKWITSSSILKWFDNAVKSARTIEEIYSLCGESLRCRIQLYHKTEFTSQTVLVKYCKTTKEILDWIEEAKNYSVPENYNSYWNVGFCGIKSLKMGRPVKDYVPLVCKCKNRYICNYSDNRISFTTDKYEAIIFENKKKFDETLYPVLRKFNYSYRLIDADTLNKVVEKNYVIARDTGGYLLKKSSTKAYITYDINKAKAFATENATEKYIEEKLYNFASNYTAVKLEA